MCNLENKEKNPWPRNLEMKLLTVFLLLNKKKSCMIERFCSRETEKDHVITHQSLIHSFDSFTTALRAQGLVPPLTPTSQKSLHRPWALFTPATLLCP